MNYAEWIKSDGNQYIILPYKPNQNTRIVCKCQIDTISSGGSFPFGVRTNANSQAFTVAWTTSQVFFNYNNTYQFVNHANLYEVMTIDANKNKATFTGATTTTITIAAGTFTCAYDLTLFALNQGGTILTGENGFKGKAWSYRIYESDVLLYDLWPCYDPDGVACLYDKVTETYFYNAGTGSFVAG